MINKITYSFCYTIKNRTNIINNFDGLDKVTTQLKYPPISSIKLTPFENSLNSIKESFNDIDDYEIIIIDFNSDDTDYLWLEEMNFNYKLIKINEHFNRGRGLNLGASYSTGENIFFIDVDMLISKELINQSNEILKTNKAFFPICFSYKSPDHVDGWWRDTGYGMVIVNKEYWENNDIKWWEKDSWGLEDSELFEKLKSVSKRDRGVNFYHQWHSDDIDFKLKHYKNKRMN